MTVAIGPGKYTLHQTLVLTATHPRTLLPCAHASVEFAPDPALDPLWLGSRESFHGAVKKDFGFQVILRIAPDPERRTGPEPLPATLSAPGR